MKQISIALRAIGIEANIPVFADPEIESAGSDEQYRQLLNMWDQQRHPELCRGEVWYMNATKRTFREILYQTKRMGKIAYDTNGRMVAGMRKPPLFPVFVQETEFRKRYREPVMRIDGSSLHISWT